MDENNINVTITAPSLTAAEINGIVTAGEDGNYHITYTNLTAGQIEAIGQTFANKLAETDQNGNSTTGLKRVALTGNYEDLNNAPSLDNWPLYITHDNELDEDIITRPAFDTIAFTGNYNDLQNIPTFSSLAYSNDYNNINNAPRIPDDINNENHAYETIEHEADEEHDNEIWYSRELKPLHEIAFSGNYEDLIDAPQLPEDDGVTQVYETINEGELNETRIIKPFHEIAFTGNYQALNNKPLIHINLNLLAFENPDIDITENNKLKTLGSTNTYILDFNGFINVDNDISLANVINNYTSNYLIGGQQIYITTSDRRYFVNNIYRILENNNIATPSYIKMDYISFNDDNYDTIRYSGNNFDENEAISQLAQLTITPQSGYFIFDYINNVIYCKNTN